MLAQRSWIYYFTSVPQLLGQVHLIYHAQHLPDHYSTHHHVLDARHLAGIIFYTHYCEFINSVFDLDAIADHELELFNTMLMDRDSELRTVVWGPETAIFIQFCSVPWTHWSVCYFI